MVSAFVSNRPASAINQRINVVKFIKPSTACSYIMESHE